MFPTSIEWPFKELDDPFQGWDYEDVLRQSRGPSNDIYGRLYAYLEHIITRFCKRLKSGKIQFFLHCVETATDLPLVLEKHDRPQKYDRIEVSTVLEASHVAELC